MKKFLSFISVIFFSFSLILGIRQAYAQNNYVAKDPDGLAANIDLFFQAGAQGFLVWQYSGNLQSTYFANDKWSFFQTDEEICNVLKQKSQEYPNKFVGVNMYNVGSSEFANGSATEHMLWLKQNCGTSVIRIFAKVEGITGVSNALKAANDAGIKLIVSIGDYSNGGGGIPSGAGKSWYQSGFRGEYETLVTNLVNNFSGNSALFGFELANEPHCSGDATAINDYKNWGVEIGNILGSATPNVGYGQMASQNTTRCDSPGPEDFLETNSIPQITMTSAHFYTDSEKQNALLALEQSKQLGKMFYIGEAPPRSSVPDESEYNLDNYPSYDANDDEFYLTPIAQVSYPASGNKLGALVKELTYTGYEAYCIAEDVNIEPSFNTDGIIQKFLEQYPSGVTLKTTSSEELGSENAKYPNWRDVSGKKFLFTSLEEYLGFKDVYETDASKSELNSAAANSLMSDKQICTQGWKDLDAQLNMCDRLENPEGCALLPRPVPGTGFTIKTLLEERRKFEEFIAYSVNDENIKANCDTLLSEKYPQWNELTKGIMNTPIDFDRAYRIGFIVASIRTTEIIPDTPLTMFNFFTQEGKDANGEMPTDEVLVIAFKLPDVGTSKGNIPKTELSGHELENGGDDQYYLSHPVTPSGYEHISVSEFWRDPLDLTRRVLSSAIQETKYQYNRELVRRRGRSKSINAGDQTKDSDIYCYKGNWPPDDSTYATDTCKNELPRALVNIINGTAKIDILTQKPKKCGGDSEIVNTIEDLANLGEPSDSRRFFKEGGPDTTSGGKVLLNLFASVSGYGVKNYNDPDGDGITDPRVASNNFPNHLFHSDFNFNEDEYPPKTVKHTTASYYLVYPVGFDLSQVENTLKGAFFSSTQIKDMEDQSKATKFDMNDTIQVLHGGGASHTFVDKVKTDNHECGDDINGNPNDCHSTFSVNIIGGGGGMNVLGAEFGWWLRKIQASLNSSATSAHSYLQSCETTEEFLLGKCGQ